MRAAAPARFAGRVATGRGEAVGFTTEDWAREGFRRLVGIDPFPGTLNLTMVDAPARAGWAALRATEGIRMPPPDPAWCDAWLFPVTLKAGNGAEARGAVVLPEVADYPDDQVEVIAPVNLREALGIADGDMVEILPGNPDRRGA